METLGVLRAVGACCGEINRAGEVAGEAEEGVGEGGGFLPEIHDGCDWGPPPPSGGRGQG
jgi:hypothetical protein